MKQFLLILAGCFILLSCSKREEKAMDISGIWDLEQTTITDYINNEPQADSAVSQSGRMIFTVTGKLDNPCSNNLAYAPCIDFCYWDIPRKKLDQLFFYSYDEYAFSIYTESCMVQKLTRKKLEIVKILYDSDLNILRKSVWKFQRAGL